MSFNDREEMERVRSNFLKKKLGLTNSDAESDAAIKAVSEKMKSDHTKNRVTLLFIGRVLWKAFGSQLRRLVVQRHRQGAGVVAAH